MSQKVLTTKLATLQKAVAQVQKDLHSVAKVVKALQEVIVGGRATLGTISATGITSDVRKCK